MASNHGILVRRAVLLGVPILYVLLGLLHPTANPEVGDETGLFIGLHVAQLVLIGGLAAVLWLLVEGLESRAATVARLLIVPFVILYTALDAVLGIAWGIAARKGDELAASDQAGAAQLVEALLEPEPLGYTFYFGAGLLWLATVLAVVTAIGRRAPAGALVLMAVGAAVFALGHAPPMGPIGMSLFLAGVVWLELRPRREPAGGTIKSTIVRLDPPQLITWTGRTLGIDAVHVWRLDHRGGRTLARTEETYDGLVARILRRPLQRVLDKTLIDGAHHLKAEAERPLR